MSVKIMGQVWDLELPHAHMLVLLSLADHADHQGGSVYPGTGLVAWKCGYSLRQTQRIMDELISMGLLIEIENEPGKRVVYRIDLSVGKQKPPYKGRQNVTRVKKSPVTFAHEGGDILSNGGVTFAQNGKPANEAPETPKTPRRSRTNHHVDPSIEPSPSDDAISAPIGGGDGGEKPNGKTELYYWMLDFGVKSSTAALQVQHHDPELTKAMFQQEVGNTSGDERERRIGRVMKALKEDGPRVRQRPTAAPLPIAIDRPDPTESRRKTAELMRQQRGH